MSKKESKFLCYDRQEGIVHELRGLDKWDEAAAEVLSSHDLFVMTKEEILRDFADDFEDGELPMA